MLTAEKRITQRAPQSCVYCTRRKLRCSKTIPCSNCIERGLQERCHREAVILSSRSVQKKNTGRPRTYGPSSQERSVANAAGSPLSPTVQTNSPDPRVSGSPAETAASIRAREMRSPNNSGSVVSVPEEPEMIRAKIWDKADSIATNESDLAIEAAMSLESLAWGAQRDQPSRISPSPAIMALTEQLEGLLRPEQVREVLGFHKVHVAWMHNVIYMPLFRRECEKYLSRQHQRDAAWFSLYCAVLCTGVYYMATDHHRDIGLQDGYGVAKELYRIATEAITKSDFMIVQSIHSLQAIAIILLCAHSFGDERRMSVLLSCATNIAQSHSHRLHTQHTDASARLTFKELADREVHRRVWCFLCTQDWYRIGSRKSYSIFPGHASYPAPANCPEDFDDAVQEGSFCDLPLSVQTQSTYMLFLFRFTSQYRDLFDRLCAINARGGSVAESFEEILATDSRLEALMNEVTGEAQKIQEASEAGANGRLGHLVAQRRALVIASWHQRLMVHRSFFCRSFQDKRYHYSRFVSLAAARSILRAYIDPSRSQATTEIWTIPAHVISSCIIMTLNSLFTAEKQTVERSDMDLMHQCLDLLEASERPSSIVERGSQIIRHLLSQEAKSRFKTLDTDEISQLATRINSSTSGTPLAQPQSWCHDQTAMDVHSSGGYQIFEPLGDIQVDVMDQINGFFGEDDFYMPYLYDPVYQRHLL
ncbi:hypothetical protein GQ53DRAFT_675121 [Thozetella sp. PMI_491]|nr:hypothetical protein GQ53DRAFT_675121 [Thozetella sp. PMI_491]